MEGHERNFQSFKRFVVKVGTSSVNHPNGKPNLFQIESLVRQLADLSNQGKEVILVSSGAVGTGSGKLNLPGKLKSIPEKQAAAAVGQSVLMHIYAKIFAEYGLTVGQVLLTREDFSDRRRFLNARNAMCTLFRLGVIPIVNENDTVAVDEIKLGDNDNLSALVACLVDAEILFLLSDVDGLYTADPRKNSDARIIYAVDEITAELESQAGDAGSRMGTGGMTTKLQAARIAMHSGVVTVIARSEEKDVLRRIIAGEREGTVFWPLAHKLENKKKWIAYSSTVQGKVFVDKGAAQALSRYGKSLLPSGITGVEGVFELGNTISVVGPDGAEIAKGLTSYSSSDIEMIKGAQTGDIRRILGHKDYDEVVHRNNLVLGL